MPVPCVFRWEFQASWSSSIQKVIFGTPIRRACVAQNVLSWRA